MTTRRRLLLLLLIFLGLCMPRAVAQDTDTIAIYSPEQYISGTLPVLYITTCDNVEITSKTTYLEATCYLDPMGLEGVDSLGSLQDQVELLIKGRGNSSWNHVKKPYRLKFNDKVSLMGMDKNRHFVLAPEWPDGAGRLNWEMGFFVSRLMGLAWTCEHHPIEVVINGDYRGLYFLTEKIRVGKQRVNIQEQDDEDTDLERITGGWLCEIDNYVDMPQVVLHDRTTKKYLLTTIHSPEVLSEEQKQYITDFVKATDQAIYCPDKTSTEWEQYIDLDMLARYYLACEIIYQIEGFSGSCYWSKDRGEDTKIFFGPMWDFDTSMANWPVEKFFYEEQEGDVIANRNHWIMELVKYPRFQRYVRELWQQWSDSAAAQVHPHCEEWLERVRVAHLQDVKRWYEYMSGYTNIDNRSGRYLEHYDRRQQWLAEQWAKPIPLIGDADGNWRVDTADVATLRRQLLGQPVDTLAWATANTYDDEVIDICDLVGVVRQVYRQDHPDAELRYCHALPYGVSDKAADKKLKLTPRLDKDSLALIADLERKVQLRFEGQADLTAFDFDLHTPISDVTDIVFGEAFAHHQVNIVQISDTLTHILIYSDSLLTINTTDENAFITLTLKYHDQDESLNYKNGELRVGNIHVAEDNMTPHYLTDAIVPIHWTRKPMKGDVNCDGVADIDDMNLIINCILRKSSLVDLPYADINGTGVVDIDDINELLNLMTRANPFVDYNIDGVKFKMVKVRGGTFTMGATAEQGDKALANEKPAHQVKVNDYLIGQVEVTQALWQAVMDYNPSYFTGDLQCPVENVTWEECQLFIARLNEITGYHFRMPTEAEWEYAARGGNKSQGFKYAGADHSATVAWHDNNSLGTTHPVAQLQPNELEIYDMSGNVMEWCQDWYASEYAVADGETLVNPTGPETGTKRVCRGGSWYHAATCCRVSYRRKLEPTSKTPHYGLRLAQ